MKVKGFTLVEILITIAIIALIAAIAIPSLLRARIASNDAVAKSTLRVLSTAAENYASANAGTYPSDVDELTTAIPPYLNRSYCATTVSSFGYDCSLSGAGYTFIATPVGSLGSGSFSVTTGGVLVEE